MDIEETSTAINVEIPDRARTAVGSLEPAPDPACVSILSEDLPRGRGLYQRYRSYAVGSGISWYMSMNLPKEQVAFVYDVMFVLHRRDDAHDANIGQTRANHIPAPAALSPGPPLTSGCTVGRHGVP